MLASLRADLRQAADSEKKKVLQSFFKTGPGQYGEGDVFLGVTVPQSRLVARKYRNLPFDELEELLHSKIHEERLVALLILVHEYETTKNKKYVNFYLSNTGRVNNWDLVDLSAPKILGHYLLDKPRKLLYQFATSSDLWERRIAIVATYTFIRNGEFADTLKISEILLNDQQDLIHKAVGWMLREVGKKDETVLEEFLKTHHKSIPRTALRYAIERLSAKKKEFYMRK